MSKRTLKWLTYSVDAEKTDSICSACVRRAGSCAQKEYQFVRSQCYHIYIYVMHIEMNTIDHLCGVQALAHRLELSQLPEVHFCCVPSRRLVGSMSN